MRERQEPLWGPPSTWAQRRPWDLGLNLTGALGSQCCERTWSQSVRGNLPTGAGRQAGGGGSAWTPERPQAPLSCVLSPAQPPTHPRTATCVYQPPVRAGTERMQKSTPDGIPRSGGQKTPLCCWGAWGGPERPKVCPGSRPCARAGTRSEPSSVSSKRGHRLHPGTRGGCG